MGKRILLGLGAVVFLAAVAFAVTWAQRLPEGAQPVAWDRDACAHCHMHVSDHAFAAQLQTQDGLVLQFDDPGCLLSYLHDRKPQVHATWFRHASADRWVSGEQVRFSAVDIARSPMGFGLAAGDDGEGLDLAAATAKVGAGR